MSYTLTPQLASRFAKMTLGHLGREFPNKLDHILDGPDDAQRPIALHPIFYGSLDWHSCVHGWWQVMRLLRLFPDMPEADAICARADNMLTKAKAAGELAYLLRPYGRNFERPYGWAWLLALHHELSLHQNQGWAAAIAPLAETFAAWFADYLPKLNYPNRHGIHNNTAFALVLAREWAEDRDLPLVDLIDQNLIHWFGGDRAAQVWEPSGDEFLSPTLIEALVMSRIFSREVFEAWFDAFLPDLTCGLPSTLLIPALVSDRTDGKIAHLDGLNLSRAWCWREIAMALPDEHVGRKVGRNAAQRHLDVTLEHLGDDYMGEHWLATFALLALQAPG